MDLKQKQKKWGGFFFIKLVYRKPNTLYLKQSTEVYSKCNLEKIKHLNVLLVTGRQLLLHGQKETMAL